MATALLSKSIDARWFQIAFLGTFFTFGLLFKGWIPNVVHYATVFVVALSTQTFWIRFKGLPDHRSLLSAAITSFSLCMLLKTNAAWVSALAAALAVSSKFLFRMDGKHFFNPANVGLVAAFLTGEAWLSPGQWGSGYAMLFLFCATGLMVVGKVGRIETTAGFLLTYLGLEAVRQLWYLGWELDVWTHKLTNGSLLLFAFFMITDPRSIPNRPWVRTVWAAAIGAVSFVAINFFYKYSAFVWALFFFSPLTPFLDRHFPAKTFAWTSKGRNDG